MTTTRSNTGRLFDGSARPVGDTLREMRRASLTSLGLGGLLLAVAFIAIVPLASRLTRDLGRLTDGVRRIDAGDRTARVDVRSRDEVGDLARAFNQMAADLNQRAEALRTADHDRRQLLADVSHELMTPLTAIRGYLETLAMVELQLDSDTRRRYLSVVREETARLERLIGDLMDLARLEAGGGSFVCAACAVGALFRRVVERHEREAAEKGVGLTSRIDPPGLSVNVDAARMEQALQNLAANALRHTGQGGTVHLDARAHQGGIVIQVHDSGEGIAPEHLAHVFDRFYKADASRAGDSRGSGLGLSIVKAIVERHRGRISVQSQPGQGTTFEIVLPDSAP